MMTPPPRGQGAPKSTGQTRAMTRPPQRATSAPPTRPPQQTPPPAPQGGSGDSGRQAATQAPKPPQTPITKPKTQGLPIKTKIVLGMATLACATSLLIFIVVMIVATNSLEDTIEQSGLGMTQQAQAIHRPYRANLTERGLIAYFQLPTSQSGELGKLWRDNQARWFDKEITPSKDFASWDQLKEERLWILVASQIRRGEARGVTNEIATEVLGPEYAKIRDTKKGAKVPAPNAPRKVNLDAMERYKGKFPGLFKRFKLQESQSFLTLRSKVYKDTEKMVLDDQTNGLRMRIFFAYKRDFVKDLDEVTTKEGSQIKRIVFKMESSILPGISATSLTVVSPQAEDGDQSLSITPSADTKTVEDVNIDRGATLNETPVYTFSTKTKDGDELFVFLDREKIESRKSNLTWSILGISILAVIMAIVTAFLVGGSITKPLETLMTDIQIISNGNFDHQPRARSRDEVGIVSRLLGDMAAGLKSAQDVWLENQSRKHDLDIAKEIQENLLPKHVPKIAGYDVSAYYSPSKEVGGDYYDFFLVDKTHLGMVCADVSGKGIPGSMVMMMTKALVSYEAQDNLSPRDIFCKVNRTLAKDIKRGMFVTAFYMVLDIPTARLTVASAGHNPLLLYRAATKQCIEVNPGGIALGFDKDGRLFERNMKEETIQLQRGDRAVIYTDGVTEAMSPQSEEFGEDRLMAITQQCASKSSNQYLTQLVNAIQSHAQTDEQHDDITIVTVKVG